MAVAKEYLEVLVEMGVIMALLAVQVMVVMVEKVEMMKRKKILLLLVVEEAEVLLMEMVEKVAPILKLQHLVTMVPMDLHLKVETEDQDLIREA